jgi:enamine deaminase RidA (YjgF/YER057c/UK114 family)
LRVGGHVWVSGTGPVWPDGTCPDDVEVQTRRCIDDAAAVSAVHGEIFGQLRPAATIVVIAALLDPRWKIEVEAEAVIQPS